MTTDVWARQEADKAYPFDSDSDMAFQGGIVHAFDALLSDKAVRAMQTQLINEEQSYIPGHELYAALQAAIAAVTEGDE